MPENFQLVQEAELGVIIGKTCKNVPESDAMSYVGGYCLALDMTASSELVNSFLIIAQINHPTNSH